MVIGLYHHGGFGLSYHGGFGLSYHGMPPGFIKSIRPVYVITTQGFNNPSSWSLGSARTAFLGARAGW